MSKLLNCLQLGRLLGLSKPTIAALQRRGVIKHVKEGGIGRAKFFDLDEVMDAIVEQDMKITPGAMARVAEFQAAHQGA